MTILILDEQTLLRTGMQAFLENIWGEYHLLQAANVDEALHILQNTPVHLVISEIEIGGTVAPSLIEIFRILQPGLSVLFYSAFPERLHALTVMRAGADGFISKQSKLNELVRAISLVNSGSKYMSIELQSSFLSQIVTDPKALPFESMQRLSGRETIVFKLVVEGKTTKEIASNLELKCNTVSTYKKRIYQKMNVSNQFELSQKACLL